MSGLQDKQARHRLLHLYRCRSVSRTIIRHLLTQDPSLTYLYDYSSNQLQELLHLSIERANLLYYDLHDNHLIKQVNMDFKNYHIWTIIDENYPTSLRQIPDPPVVLYGLGNPSFIHYQPSLSVVGTRQPSREAKKKMYTILAPLITEKWLFVSGMALGIDGYAHRLANYYDGKTIAVLGSGLASVYPKQHLELFHQLVTSHLVISEYLPDTPPKRYHFPERNRIISGLSFGTIVIEAKEKSGSLITVDQALEQGREVYAIPGSPWLEQTKGCHKMIQDGAKLVQHPEDLLQDWNESQKSWLLT